MNTKKYILAVVLILVLAISAWKFIGKRETSNEPLPQINEENLATTTPLREDSAGQAEKDQAWAVLQKYLSFAKANDIKGLTSLSYQLSDSCKNYDKSTDNKKDCDAKMQSVYSIGSQFKKADYTIVWSDSKQTILSTPFYRADAGEEIASYLHGVIFFVKSTDGSIKLLSFNPARGIFLPKTATSTKAEIDKKLKDAVIDLDKDGMEDQVESCIRTDVACTKTNPQKRDTDGDGFWDGVEALFYK